MKTKLILTIAAMYLGLVGIGLLAAPNYTVFGLPNEASPLLIAELRAMSDVFIGVAVMDWAARNAETSRALDAIFLGNAVGFSLSVILGTVVALTGGLAVSWVFTGISLLCAVGFIIVGRANTSAG